MGDMGGKRKGLSREDTALLREGGVLVAGEESVVGRGSRRGEWGEVGPWFDEAVKKSFIVCDT